jgi:Tol biopolymer transport system component
VSGGFVGFQQMAWYDRAGKLINSVGESGPVVYPALSPDGKAIAFSRGANGNLDIWVRDLARANDIRLTSDGINSMPIWSPQGDRVIFRSTEGGNERLRGKLVSGSGQEESVLLADSVMPYQWSRDGRFIVYAKYDPSTKWDLWVLPVGKGDVGDQKPFPFLRSEFEELHGQLSPDSRWMAYTADDSGQREVYVRRFPSSEGL